MASGVHVGVGVKLPRIPAVFPRKRKWALESQRLPEGDGPGSFDTLWKDNYVSAKEATEDLAMALREQATRGHVIELSEDKALDLYGKRLIIAALAAIPKAGADGSITFRIIHDGTNGVHLNSRIRVRDAGQFPTAPDLKLSLRMQEASGEPHFGFSADVKEAHRMIGIKEEDWPMLGCKAGKPVESVFLNTRGTYGVASAAYWWGRIGAALVRLVHYTWGSFLPGWLMLFADDWDVAARGRRFREIILVFILLLQILGVPLSWHKCAGGFRYNWCGYELCRREWALGISARRADWLLLWFDRVIRDRKILVKELREVLGRLVFAYGAVEWDNHSWHRFSPLSRCQTRKRLRIYRSL
jgi:hypothetical protein